MKFFLVNDRDSAPMTWSREESLETDSLNTTMYYRSTVRKLNITSINSEPLEMYKCALLKKFLEAENSSDREGFWSCRVIVQVSALVQTLDQVFNVLCGCLGIVKRNGTEKDCLGQLAESFEGAKIQVDWNMVVNEASVWSLSTTEMNLTSGLLMHQDLNVLCPAEHFENWKTPSKTILNRMKISVTIPDPIFYTCCGSISSPSWSMSLTILQDEVLSDVTIVCGDGTELKAHRSFLAAQSPVFLAMFQTDMKEARERILEIPDMETKCVRAFLKFLYCGDTQDADGEVHVALELFQAGHKYGIKFLEERMRGLIVGKPNDWFDLDAVVRIFMFARNLTPTDEELKRKMGKLIELYSATLEESPVMQELFRTNHKAALELLKYSHMRDSNTR